jgi:recombinational DNA repair ATPase RecF
VAEPTIPGASREEVPPSARDLLVEWANQQDGWVRAIVGDVVSTRRELSAAAIAEVKARYLAEKQLTDLEAPAVPEMGVAGEVDEPLDPLKLVALRDCRGVNALAENQSIAFHPRLTVLFGENAMGKTGYVRVLKRLANVRSAEPIIPDIHRPLAAADAASATVRFAIGDVEEEVAWQGEAGVPPFTRMTVFDSPAVALHLEGSVTYLFTPADLALFRYTHSAIEAVRVLLDADLVARQPRQNSFITAFTRGTVVHAEIEALSASTSLTTLTQLATLSETERNQIGPLRASVETLSSAASGGRREALRSRANVLQHLVTLSDALKAFEQAAYDDAVTAEAQARGVQADAADVLYREGKLPAELRPSWQAFIDAGERYLVASDRSDYPESDADCIYCGQKLGEASAALVQAYRAYASGAGAAAVATAHDRAVSLGSPLMSDQASTAVEAVRTILPGLEDGDAVPDWAADGRSLLDLAVGLREAVAESRTTARAGQVTEDLGLRARLSAAAIEAGATLTAMDGDAKERQRLLGEDRSRLAVLEDRQTLARLLPDIQSYVEQAAWSLRLRTLMTRFPALLRSLTETSKTASQDIVNRDFERAFFRECAALRAPTVALDFPGRRGEASRHKSVAPDHSLAEILSQGEQKVIAIADFLAEASLRTTSAPIVFDDPVDSFDYRRVGEIAKRIADLSDEQQVVVFTHNIMFAANLLGHFEERPSECLFYQVTQDNGHKGVISKATHARLDSLSGLKARVNEALQAAQGADDGDRQNRIDAAYDHIRAWCEVAVETKLLAKVTQRYQPNVAMQQLERIRPDRLGAAIAVIYPIWERSNRYIPGHSQPLETLGVRPTMDELRADWTALQQALRDYEAA